MPASAFYFLASDEREKIPATSIYVPISQPRVPVPSGKEVVHPPLIQRQETGVVRRGIARSFLFPSLTVDLHPEATVGEQTPDRRCIIVVGWQSFIHFLFEVIFQDGED